MGLTPSRNMSSPSHRLVDSDSGNSADDDSDVATVLQYLIRSRTLRFFSEQPDYVAGPRQTPPCMTPVELRELRNTEIAHFTSMASGRENQASVTSLLARRQGGQLKGGRGFSKAEQCGINNRKIVAHKRAFNIKIVDNYDSKAFCGVYNKSGSRLLTTSQDRIIRIYDSSNGNFCPLLEIQGRDVGWSILDASFSPDSNSLAYSSWSSNLHFVDLDSDFSHTVLPLAPMESKFCIFSLKFSSSGNEILCGANDSHIYMYNLEANRRNLKVDAHDDDVNTVAFADDASNILFSGSDDGLIKVWDRRSLNEQYPKPVGVLAGHHNGIVYIDSRGDGRHLISNSKDQSIKLWDMRKFSSNEAQEKTKRAASLGRWDYRWQNAPVKLLGKIKGDTSLATYRGHSVLQTQIRCHFSPAFHTGQRFIYTGCATGAIIIYDILTGIPVVNNVGHLSVVRDVSWHPFRNEIISVSWDSCVMCWSPALTSAPPDKEKDIDDPASADDGASWEGSIWDSGRRRPCRLANSQNRFCD